MSRRIAELLLLPVLAVAVAGGAAARNSDRNQPMDAESNTNSCTLGDAGQCVLTGNVHITQGSLDVRAAKAVIYRGNGDISRAVLTGSPVSLKQVLDDGTLMTATAATVDYNLRSDVVVFTGDVNIQQPQGSMSGERVVYNLKTSSVDSGGQGNGRVHMRILPRGKDGDATGGDKPAGAGNAEGTGEGT
jgi:lipopolysaccharide export system protein LptA